MLCRYLIGPSLLLLSVISSYNHCCIAAIQALQQAAVSCKPFFSNFYALPPLLNKQEGRYRSAADGITVLQSTGGKESGQHGYRAKNVVTRN
jgi:hypothetical protein